MSAIEKFQEHKAKIAEMKAAISSYLSSIAGDGEYISRLAEEAYPQFYETQSDEKKEYTYLNKLLNKYPTQYAIPNSYNGEVDNGLTHSEASILYFRGDGVIRDDLFRVRKEVWKLVAKRHETLCKRRCELRKKRKRARQ